MPFLTRPRFIAAACRQTDRMYVHVRDQNDNATYASTRWVPTVRHFLACEDVAGGSQQSGGESFILPVIWTPFLACEDVAGRSQQSGGETLFFRVKRMQLHACVHGRGASPLSASHIQSSSDDSRLLTTLITLCRAHQGRWMKARPRLR